LYNCDFIEQFLQSKLFVVGIRSTRDTWKADAKGGQSETKPIRFHSTHWCPW